MRGRRGANGRYAGKDGGTLEPGLGRIWASQRCVDDRGVGFRHERDCGRNCKLRSRAMQGETMSSRAVLGRGEVGDEGYARTHFANIEKLDSSAWWRVAPTGGTHAIAEVLAGESAADEKALKATRAAAGLTYHISSCELWVKDRAQQAEGYGRSLTARRHDEEHEASGLVSYGVRGGTNFQGRATSRFHADEEMYAIDEKIRRVSNPTHGFVKLCTECVDRHLADRDDVTKMEARSAAEQRGRLGGGNRGAGQLRERANFSSERSVPPLLSTVVASVTGGVDRANCGETLAWTVRFLSSVLAERREDIRGFRRPLEEGEETLSDPFAPTLKSSVPFAASGTSVGCAPAPISVGSARWVAPDSCGVEFRFSRIQRAIRHSISASIQSSTTWRSSFRKLATRFIRESSNDSREVLENVTRMSRRGWTESNAKPPRNEPPKGEREAIRGRVSLEGRTSMVPE